MNARTYIDRLFEGNPYGYWMSPDGKLIEVLGWAGHYAAANRVLRAAFLKEHPDCPEDAPMYGFEEAYKKMFDAGYARMVLGERVDTVELPKGYDLSRRQVSALKDLGIERGTKVRLERGDSMSAGRWIYEPEHDAPPEVFA